MDSALWVYAIGLQISHPQVLLCSSWGWILEIFLHQEPASLRRVKHLYHSCMILLPSIEDLDEKGARILTQIRLFQSLRDYSFWFYSWLRGSHPKAADLSLFEEPRSSWKQSFRIHLLPLSSSSSWMLLISMICMPRETSNPLSFFSILPIVTIAQRNDQSSRRQPSTFVAPPTFSSMRWIPTSTKWMFLRSLYDSLPSAHLCRPLTIILWCISPLWWRRCQTAPRTGSLLYVSFDCLYS